jgi:hypothetical protein
LIVGGGVGGCAAALAATSLGCRVILTEPTDWVGGQLTNQLVPPDEHPWIESFGCTRRYRAYREAVRQYYRDHMPLTAAARANPRLNPGNGWVSRLCHEPRIGWQVLLPMLQPAVSRGDLEILLRTEAVGADVTGDQIDAVRFLHEGEEFWVKPRFVLEATETGSLLPLVGAEYRLGAESQAQSGEPHALPGDPEPDNVQGLTWCAVVSHDPGSHRTIDRPAQFDFWRNHIPTNWCGPLLSLTIADPVRGGTRELPILGDFGLFTYRQILDPTQFDGPFFPTTVLNWPQNDYFDGTVLDVEADLTAERLEAARQLTLSLVYWLQTEAGLPGIFLRPDMTGTPDGLAMAPYIREARRLEAQFMVTENHVSAEANPGGDRATALPNSVGVGSYRLDLHPAANGAPTLDLATVPFEIPLGSLLPVRMKNLLAAGKSLGVTHIANGCFRLHPIEWNVGEAAGLAAAYACRQGILPDELQGKHWPSFDSLLSSQGIETSWPQLRPI